MFAAFVLLCAPPGVAAAFAQGAPKPIPQTPQTELWDKLRAENNLDTEGNEPFHLQMQFQLFDLEGKPDDEGTLDLWWSAEKSFVHVQSPQMTKLMGALDTPSPELLREQYLIRSLLEDELHPVPALNARLAAHLVESQRTFGKITLPCLQSKEENADTELCESRGTDIVLVRLLPGAMNNVVRTSVGKFRNTLVGTKFDVQYAGHLAIQAKAINLKGLTLAEFQAAAQADPKLEHYASSAATPNDQQSEAAPASGVGKQAGPVYAAPGVLAGHILSRVAPVYPIQEKNRGESGEVLILAEIDETGSISELIPIAYSAKDFFDAAYDAVKKWKYQPYLINGKPVSVDTVITANFALNHR